MDRVSVVVVSHNEGENLARTVERLVETLPTGSELVVVDDMSTDGSTAFLRDATDCRTRLVTPCQRLGVAPGCNAGAQEATGEVLVSATPTSIRSRTGWSRWSTSWIDRASER